MNPFDPEHYYNNHALYLRWWVENGYVTDGAWADALIAHANGQLALRDSLISDIQRDADDFFHEAG